MPPRGVVLVGIIVTCGWLVIAEVLAANGSPVEREQVGSRLFFHEWESWKQLHGKLYTKQSDHDARYRIFEANMKFINEWNAAQYRPFELGINSFGDLTHAEFVGLLGTNIVTGNNTEVKALPTTSREDYLDYRQLDVVTKVKNQGRCGSCWAFSVVAACEGAHALAGHNLVSLSEQQLADCSLNGGCYGGDTREAMKYSIGAGLVDGSLYSYKGFTGKCQARQYKVIAKFSKMMEVKEGDEEDLAEVLREYGPVSVAIDASRSTFQFYKSGVYYDPECSSTQLDHGVAVVGYYSGPDSEDYWIVKNSWGTGWGENGFIRMARNKSNHCGIASYGTAIVGVSPEDQPSIDLHPIYREISS